MHWREKRNESKTNTTNWDTSYMSSNQGIYKGWQILKNYITRDINAEIVSETVLR
jgi:hypothetical protein